MKQNRLEGAGKTLVAGLKAAAAAMATIGAGAGGYRQMDKGFFEFLR